MICRICHQDRTVGLGSSTTICSQACQRHAVLKARENPSCARHGTSNPADFYIYKRGNPICKKCRLEYGRTWVQSNPEAAKAKSDRSWAKNRESFCAGRRKRYQDNPNPEKTSHQQWRNAKKTGESSLEWRFKRNIGGWRKKCREEGLPFDLDTPYMIHLYHTQNGLCYYTGVVMETIVMGPVGDTPNAMSLDRRDPSKGYTKGNVVLCTYFVNTAKGAHTEESFYDLCKIILHRSAERTSALEASDD